MADNEGGNYIETEFDMSAHNHEMWEKVDEILTDKGYSDADKEEILGDHEKEREVMNEYTNQQEKSWGDTVPEQYRDATGQWSNQQGVMKIVPMFQKQTFSVYEVADIAEGVANPSTQIMPISDVQVRPHQISFDFFDTTEGKIGISNATEKHMQVECDVYVTDLVYFYWNHGGTSNFSGLDYMSYLSGYFDSLGENWDSNAVASLYDFENTNEFIKFRNAFLTQFSGWVCRFVSHTFSTFNGVFTDVSYDINSGEQFAKWHLKIEEAIFTGDYSEDGKKPTETSSGDQANNSAAKAGE